LATFVSSFTGTCAAVTGIALVLDGPGTEANPSLCGEGRALRDEDEARGRMGAGVDEDREQGLSESFRFLFDMKTYSNRS